MLRIFVVVGRYTLQTHKKKKKSPRETFEAFTTPTLQALIWP